MSVYGTRGCAESCTAPPEIEVGVDHARRRYRKYLYLRRKYVSRKNMIKPTTSHYCGEIGMVVIKMDHYCPWVNNVVGLFTQNIFCFLCSMRQSIHNMGSNNAFRPFVQMYIWVKTAQILKIGEVRRSNSSKYVKVGQT